MDKYVWPRVAVMGAGAVGSYFGAMLARAGAPVTLIGRGPHIEAITTKGLFVESVGFQQVLPISASMDPRAALDAEVVLFCVKTPDTQEAAKSLAQHLKKDAVVLSLQNGIDNAERIGAVTGIVAISAVVYVAAELSAPGHVKHLAGGNITIGIPPGDAKELNDSRTALEGLATLFTRANVPCLVSEAIEADLWTKLSLNCAYNAISALGRARYGRIINNAWTRELMTECIEEVVAVAASAGIHLDSSHVIAAGLELGKTMHQALSSTAQDIARGKRTEIDSLNGYVAQRGAQLGIAAPINQTLHALVKLLEEAVSTPRADIVNG